MSQGIQSYLTSIHWRDSWSHRASSWGKLPLHLNDTILLENVMFILSPVNVSHVVERLQDLNLSCLVSSVWHRVLYLVLTMPDQWVLSLNVHEQSSSEGSFGGNSVGPGHRILHGKHAVIMVIILTKHLCLCMQDVATLLSSLLNRKFHFVGGRKTVFDHSWLYHLLSSLGETQASTDGPNFLSSL